MVELAQSMPGFIGYESVRDGVGITVSFWRDEAAIEHWKQHAEHRSAQAKGIQQWYQYFDLHVARVERFSSFRHPDS